jgi:hypothetical protein
MVPLSPPAMCETAIANAEAQTNLPAHVLGAIALRESGKIDPESGRARPWPWTINYLGTGHFFATKQEAIAAVQDIQAGGGQSVDVGCMQVNLMHHPEAFANLEEAFDPAINANYAGRFLSSLFGAFGDWGTAIAAYHSRTPGLGEPYRDQVVASWNPKDPKVLAKLSFQPLPALSGSGFGWSSGSIPGLPMVYVPFAQPGPVQISANMAYRAFMPSASAYRSFRPIAVSYGDFNGKTVKARGRPLDLRLSSGLLNSGRALVAPKGIIEKTSQHPAAKLAARSPS